MRVEHLCDPAARGLAGDERSVQVTGVHLRQGTQLLDP
jgi:hypothetical protein